MKRLYRLLRMRLLGCGSCPGHFNHAPFCEKRYGR